MEDKNNELNNLPNDEENNEKLVDELVENMEITNDEEGVIETIEVKDVVNKPNNKKPSFFKRLVQSVIDEAIILLISLLLLFLIDLILRPMGYFIAERVPFYFIIFVLANIFYAPILKATKLSGTIGEKIMKLN
ncbi:RDD family protein [Clostridium tarantellae]|uniref:RDD domain-containing protein n=1 Tax=Clostridium tarantellae TaxID=39493 RepID=A0A6I1MQB2_9CLOT|nr:RDD family protein [Clostridium tarantellae]MPQ44347.1 hypothetical protein [Clostridium tarantellae]